MPYEEGSKEEEASESPAEAKMEGDTSGTDVSPAYEKQCKELIDDATIPELEYVISSATDLKKKLMKSQSKAKLSSDSFTTENMPEM